MEAADVRGRFVWHQLMTRDVEGARNFYSKLVGWKTEPWKLDPRFTVCVADRDPAAGIMAMPPEAPAEMPSHWMNYVGTADVEGTCETAARSGGKVIKMPADEAGAGRYAILQDPQGAMFAVINPMKAAPDWATPPPGNFCWHELATTDNEAAFAFYSGLFGWEAMQRMDMGPIGTYLIFGSNGIQRGGIYHKPPDMPAPPNWLPYVSVPRTDAAFEAAIRMGGASCVPPMDVPGGGRIANFMDPAGAMFAVHSVAVAAASAPAKPKAKAKAQTKAKPKAKAKGKTKAKVKSKARPAARPKSKVKAKTRANAKAKARTKTKAKSRTKPKMKRAAAKRGRSKARSKK